MQKETIHFLSEVSGIYSVYLVTFDSTADDHKTIRKLYLLPGD